MSDHDTKYPLHAVKRNKARGNPCYEGSGALHDRFEKPHDVKNPKLPARGEEKAHIYDGAKAHFRNPDHQIDKVEGRIGSWDHQPMKLGKVHGFRAHAKHEGAHGVTKHDNDTALRFSGNAAAHRIGDKGGRFGKSNFHTQGLPNVEGGNDRGIAGMDPIGKAHSKVQRGNKAQPKGHKSVVEKHPEAKKKGREGGKVTKMRAAMR